MKPSLQLKISQHLALTPQLQQSIRLLQLSTLELEQELEKYLVENPLLERAEEEYAPVPPTQEESHAAAEAAAEKPEPEAAEALPNDDDSWLNEGSGLGATGSGSGSDEDDNDYQDVQAATVSLHEHLGRQVGLMTLSDRDQIGRAHV